MRIVEKGHHYFIANKNDGYQEIKFVNTVSGEDGVIIQEVLRCLIDRMLFMDNQLPHDFNKSVIFNLRQSLVLMESRHLLRLVEKNMPVENISANPHFVATAAELGKILETKNIKEVTK